jgi:hypothetical protein
LYQDAIAAYTYLREIRGVDPRQLVVFGRSLGAAVAGNLAAEASVAGLILESPFLSIEAVAKAYYGGITHKLLAARFDLGSRLARISVPVLVIHGDRDRTIPLELGEQVYQAAHPPKSFYLVHGADHNDLYLVGGTQYFHRLKKFIEEVCVEAH